jgi:phytoene synthase
MDSVSGRAVVSGRRKAWVLAGGLGSITVPMGPLHKTTVPEGIFLIDAVVRTAPPVAVQPDAPPWWALTERMLWTLDLFTRLEQRERVQP